MHEHSTRARSAARWPTGHIGWVYRGMPEFEGRVASFLAEGHTRRERQVFIADDPRASLWPKHLMARGSLIVLSTAEVYGPERIADPATQRTAFESFLVEARALGYTGIRVAADNTSLTSGPDRLEAWLRWEHEADLLMHAHPITRLCAFDQTRSDPLTLEAVMSVHQTQHATGPQPVQGPPTAPA